MNQWLSLLFELLFLAFLALLFYLYQKRKILKNDLIFRAQIVQELAHLLQQYENELENRFTQNLREELEKFSSNRHYYIPQEKLEKLLKEIPEEHDLAEKISFYQDDLVDN